MTRLEFAGLVKNMVGHMVANGYISSKWRGEFMLAAHKAGYKVKITDINKVMT